MTSEKDASSKNQNGDVKTSDSKGRSRLRACKRCLSRVPLASLVAWCMCVGGIVIFSACLYEAVRYIVIRFDVAIVGQIVWLILIIHVILATFFLLVATLSTGQTRREVCTCCLAFNLIGRCSQIVVIVIAYIFHFIWLLLPALLLLPVAILTGVMLACVLLPDCINLADYGIPPDVIEKIKPDDIISTIKNLDEDDIENYISQAEVMLNRAIDAAEDSPALENLLTRLEDNIPPPDELERMIDSVVDGIDIDQVIGAIDRIQAGIGETVEQVVEAKDELEEKTEDINESINFTNPLTRPSQLPVSSPVNITSHSLNLYSLTDRENMTAENSSVIHRTRKKRSNTLTQPLYSAKNESTSPLVEKFHFRFQHGENQFVCGCLNPRRRTKAQSNDRINHSKKEGYSINNPISIKMGQGIQSTQPSFLEEKIYQSYINNNDMYKIEDVTKQNPANGSQDARENVRRGKRDIEEAASEDTQDSHDTQYAPLDTQQITQDVKEKAEDIRAQARTNTDEIQENARDLASEAADIEQQIEKNAANLSEVIKQEAQETGDALIEEAKEKAQTLQDAAEQKAREVEEAAEHLRDHGDQMADEVRGAQEDLAEDGRRLAETARQEADSIRRDAQETGDKIVETAEDIAEDMQTKAEETGRQIAEEAKQRAEDIQNRIGDASKDIGQTADKVKEQAEQLADDAEELADRLAQEGQGRLEEARAMAEAASDDLNRLGQDITDLAEGNVQNVVENARELASKAQDAASNAMQRAEAAARQAEEIGRRVIEAVDDVARGEALKLHERAKQAATAARRVADVALSKARSALQNVDELTAAVATGATKFILDAAQNVRHYAKQAIVGARIATREAMKGAREAAKVFQTAKKEIIRGYEYLTLIGDQLDIEKKPNQTGVFCSRAKVLYCKEIVKAHYYIIFVFVASIIICLSMVHFLMAMSANYVHVKREMKPNKLRKNAAKDTEELGLMYKVNDTGSVMMLSDI